MGFESLVSDVLDGLAAGQGQQLVPELEAHAGSGPRSLLAMAHFWVGDFERAVAAADQAVAAAATHAERSLGLAVLALAAAGTAPRPDDTVAQAVGALDPGCPRDRGEAFVGYLVAEAALTQARLAEAASVSAWAARAAELWAPHPYAAVMAGAVVRIALFEGRVADAERALASLRALAATPRTLLFADAIESLVRGNAADVAETERLLTSIDEAEVSLVDHLGRGILLLGAFGAIALGDTVRSADAVLAAGRDAGLTRFTVIDRALGLELLVAGSIAGGDRDAAHAWGAQAEALAAHPIAAPTVDRLQARLALLDGDAARSAALAARSARACRTQGRGVEAAESEVVLGQARLANRDVAEAARTLRDLVAESDRLGHKAVRRAVGQTLGRAGRRLPPVSGDGWTSLSVRETEIAHLILAGHETVPIARALLISPQTVRVHTSRILAAFGVGTRVQLVARHGAGLPEPTPDVELTPRQRDVVIRAAGGDTNAAIGDALGVSVKTVEKHLAQASSRLGAGSRLDLILRWQGQSEQLRGGEVEQGRAEPGDVGGGQVLGLGNGGQDDDLAVRGATGSLQAAASEPGADPDE
jgi:DNA-binding NarL/FixJ family response regulator